MQMAGHFCVQFYTQKGINMIIMRFPQIFVVCLLSFFAMAISCADNNVKSTTHTLDTVTKVSQVHIKKDSQLIFYDFSEFYSTFSSVVNREDWKYLAELTKFPFVLKGELDDEEQVVFDKDGFIRAIDGILRENIYINDKLVETSYFKLILNPKNLQYDDGDEAELFGILFSKKSDVWKLSMITTHIHIIEKYLEDK